METRSEQQRFQQACGELVVAAEREDRAAINRAMVGVAPKLRQALRGLAQSQAARSRMPGYGPDDLVSETIVRVLRWPPRSRPGLSALQSVVDYACVTLRSVALEAAGRTRARRAMAEATSIDAPATAQRPEISRHLECSQASPEDEVVALDLLKKVRAEVASMGPSAEAALQAIEAETPASEYAQSTGRAVGTVFNERSRMRAAIRERFEWCGPVRSPGHPLSS